ncbi:MAG: T9SS type A sorting domain-containing protein [Bacteroidales bacterium]
MRKIILAVAAIFFLTLVNAQHTNVLIGDQGYPEEPTIMINPKNTNEIVAGANIDKYYYSKDGGLTWTEGTLASSYGVWGDPCIIVDTAGSFYFFHLSDLDPPAGNWIDRIVCQKADSVDGQWSDGSYTWVDGIKAQDKEWAVVDRNNNIIYVTWTQFDKYPFPIPADPTDSSIILFSRSIDGGQTWSVPVRINKIAGDCVDSDNTTEGAVPTVGPNGEVYVAWAGPEGLLFDKSLDSGNTWLDNDIFVSDIPGGWDYTISGINRCNGLPVTACDLSNSPYKGTIYINWTDQRNGTTDTDVWLSKSTDGGNTWSAAKRVNDDVPGKQQFFTWMTVDQVTGYLYFVFYDRRNYNDTRTDVYMAVSKDGGETFANFKISNSPFIPDEDVFFGDYTNISAFNNVIRPVWARYDPGQLSILTAIVDTSFLGVNNHDEPEDFSLEQNAPNPFVENTYIGFKLHKPALVSLKVYDIFGREMAAMINNEKYNTGKYIRHFDAAQYNLPSGVYYFSIISNEKMLTRKMLLLK